MQSPDQIRSWLALVSDILGVVGFAVSVYVALSVRGLRNWYVLRVRAPELTKQISASASKLIESIESIDESDSRIAIDRHLNTTSVALRSLKGKIGWRRRKTVSAALTSISNIQNGSRTRDSIETLYRDLNLVVVEIDEMLKDNLWVK